jgi:hypothetical protein
MFHVIIITAVASCRCNFMKLFLLEGVEYANHLRFQLYFSSKNFLSDAHLLSSIRTHLNGYTVFHKALPIWKEGSPCICAFYYVYVCNCKTLRSPSCLYVCNPHPPITFGMKLGTYIMAAESISAAYFVNPSHQSVCLSFLPLEGNGSVKCISLFGARQQLGKHVPATKNTRNKKESLWVCLCIPLWLLGNNSVKTFPQERRIVGSVIFMRSLSYQRKVMISLSQNFL